MNKAQIILNDLNWKTEHKLNQSQLALCFDDNTGVRLFYIESGEVALRIHFSDYSYITHLL